MDVTDEGIETLESDEHPQKAEFPMDVTDEGIETLESNEHLANDDSSISVIEESNFSEFISLFS